MTLLNMRIVFQIFRLFGILTCTWPAEIGAKKTRKIIEEIAWVFSVLNVTGLLIPLILAAYHYRNNVTTMMKSLSELTALIEVFCNLILCRIKRLDLQNLLAKVEGFAKSSNALEEAVLQKYIERYAGFMTFVGFSYAMAAIAFSAGPFLLSTTLPAETWYPFSMEKPYVRFFLYSQQVGVILQTGFSIVVDFTVAMFFWYSAARLEMLELELNFSTNVKQLERAVQKHREIISFVDETQRVVGPLLFKTNMTMTAAVICGAFPLIHHEPLPVVSQFICMVIGGCARLYITAWPADDLREASEAISLSVYNTVWMNGLPDTMKSILIIMQRSQKPLVISMSGLLPTLSLRYYGSFLYGTMSYFMTMRAVIEK